MTQRCIRKEINDTSFLIYHRIKSPHSEKKKKKRTEKKPKTLGPIPHLKNQHEYENAPIEK